jgi:hypothetical protein
MVMTALLAAPAWGKAGSGKAPSNHSGAAVSSHNAKPRSAHPAPSARAPRAKAPSAAPKSRAHGSRTTPGVPRDKHSRIARSSRARSEFEKSHPCPSTGKRFGACPGYVIDHVKPLKRGGADNPGNMQWQTTEAAKQKDRVE